MILMDGNLPTATTYTLDDASSFVIHSINWGWTTTDPLFFGPKNAPAGSVRNTCCYRVIGLATAEVEPFGGGTPADKWFRIVLDVSSERMALIFYDQSEVDPEHVIFFDWIREPVEGAETPLCAIPRGVASTLENILEADMATTGSTRYFTGVESITLLATPTYGNQDGGNAQGGGWAVTEPYDQFECGPCAGLFDITATISGLSGLVLPEAEWPFGTGDFYPTDDTAEFVFKGSLSGFTELPDFVEVPMTRDSCLRLNIRFGLSYSAGRYSLNASTDPDPDSVGYISIGCADDDDFVVSWPGTELDPIECDTFGLIGSFTFTATISDTSPAVTATLTCTIVSNV